MFMSPAFLILYLICAFYVLSYAVSSKRSTWGRVVSVIVLPVSFFMPYGWLVILLWGAVCWSDARMGNQ